MCEIRSGTERCVGTFVFGFDAQVELPIADSCIFVMHIRVDGVRCVLGLMFG